MGKKSKRLGKSFEYEVRDILRQATDLNFERTPLSGAWIGGENTYKAEVGREDVTEIMTGDIICPKGWRWTVECKNEADVPVHLLFMGDNCEKVNSYLEQVYNDSQTSKKEPLLVMKYRKSGYSLPKRIKDVLLESNVEVPKTNSTTLGILVAELSNKCQDIANINHIYYTTQINNQSTEWRFFDINNWIHYIKQRQYI